MGCEEYRDGRGAFLGEVWFASVDLVVAIHRLMLLQNPRRRRVTRIQTHLHLRVPWYSGFGGDPMLFLGTQHTRGLEHSGISYLGIGHILRNSSITTSCRMTSCIFWDISYKNSFSVVIVLASACPQHACTWILGSPL